MRTSLRAALGRTAAVVVGAVLLLVSTTTARAAGLLHAFDDTATIGSVDPVAPIDLLANDIGPDGRKATPTTVGVDTTPVQAPARGSVQISADGHAVYTPGVCSAGTDSFVYRIVDPQDAASTSSATVTVTILPGAAGVDARPDQATTNAAGVATGNLLANDCGPGARATVLLSSTPVRQPAKGSVVIDASTGTFTYRANPGATGTDSFVYRITNPVTQSLTDTAAVTITLPAAPSPSTGGGTSPPAGSNGGPPPPAGAINPPQEEQQPPPAAAPEQPELPATGVAQVRTLTIAGAALVLLGLALTIAARRRPARR